MITPKPDEHVIVRDKRSDLDEDAPAYERRSHGVEEAHDEHRIHFLRRASWSAILAGTAVAVVVQIMFTLLGISIGMAGVDPQTESNALSGIGTMTGVWTAIGALVALFLGGWIAGRMAATAETTESLLHGVVTWAVVTLIVFWTMTSVVGKVLNTATSVLGTTLSVAGQGIAAVVPDNMNPPNISATQLRSSTEDFLRQSGVSQATIDQFLNNAQQQLGTAATQAAKNPQQAYDEITTALANIAQRGQQIAQNNISTQDAARVIAQNTGMTQEQATSLVQQWSQRLQQIDLQKQAQQVGNRVQNTVERTGDAVAGAISSAAAWTVVSMVLGLIAAAAGGFLAAPKRGIPA